MLRIRWLTGLTAVLFATASGFAKPPPNPDPSLSPWFEGLIDPETALSCCAETDCRAVDARIARDHHEVLIDGAWVAIPEGKIVRRTDNPTGRAVLCWSPAMGIMCFVPGPGV
jgi:hypothetical protein